jgi:hypothetical protein
MNYKLLTTVDITHTRQHRNEPGKEHDYWREQNFNSLIQTLGLRTHISYDYDPDMIIIKGFHMGFNTGKRISIWRFDFATPTNNTYEKDDDPVGFLLDDFEMVPFISGLDESMEQNFDVFVTHGENKNIIFSIDSFENAQLIKNIDKYDNILRTRKPI